MAAFCNFYENKMFDNFSRQYDNSSDSSEKSELKQDMDTIDRIQGRRKIRRNK
jgi:hypothetical protein